MNYQDFFVFLKKWRQSKQYPPMSSWPRQIELDGNGWSGIQKIYNYTKMDGYEYETTFFYVEGDTFLTTPLRGTENEVRSTHNLSVNYEIDQKKRIYYRNVLIDGVNVSRTPIQPSKLTKNTQLGFLYNIHTHPKHLNSDEQVTYSFFSDTDIKSLIASKSAVSGLVTDVFWLVCKTDKVISKVGEVGEELLYEISEKAFAGENYLDKIINQNMSRWGLVFYRGEFNKPLIRIN